MTSNQPLLTAKNLTKTVTLATSQTETQHPHSLTIIDDVTIEVGAAESVAITGASGSGKSTLLSLLAGLDRPTTGEIHLLGQPLHELQEEQKAQLRLASIGFIFQSFQLIPTLSALQNVATPLKLRAIENQVAATATDIEQEAKNLLEKIGLSERLHHKPAQLSGGEQQRVAIARAVISKPKILFADEPTGNLDKNRSALICDWLFSEALWIGSMPAIIIVTHDPEVAARCQSVRKMESGRLIA